MIVYNHCNTSSTLNTFLVDMTAVITGTHTTGEKISRMMSHYDVTLGHIMTFALDQIVTSRYMRIIVVMVVVDYNSTTEICCNSCAFTI